MRKFKALVVDNQESIRAQAEAAAADMAGIDVRTAANLHDALDLISAEFFHLAVIDLHLTDDANHNIDGATILSLLRDKRPACKTFLLTKYASEYREEVFHLLDPQNPAIDAAIDKGDFKLHFTHALLEHARVWLADPFDVDQLEDIHGWLRDLQISGGQLDHQRKVRLSRDEVDYVVSRLFGQGTRGKEVERTDLGSIAFERLEGGKSRSIVLSGHPRDGSGGDGIHCVVKIGPAADIVEERRRYERFVRFRLSLHRRVEMLAHAPGDTVGAVCYSFAGESPEHVTDLQTLFDRSDPRALNALVTLLGHPEDWPSDFDKRRDLAGFFASAYDLKPTRVWNHMDDFANDMAAELKARRDGDTLVLDGGKLVLPSPAILGSGTLRDSYGVSVVHGDLNASNVIVADTGETALIDFRHTSLGPWSLDFAALQTSLRLSEPAVDGIRCRVVQDEAIEHKLLRHNWTVEGSWWGKAADRPPYWAQAAALLMTLTNRNLKDISRKEYAATCLLYAMRVYRAKLSGDARLRLLVYMSALCRALGA